MKIKITAGNGVTNAFDYSNLELNDLKVLLKYCGKVTIEVINE